MLWTFSSQWSFEVKGVFIRGCNSKGGSVVLQCKLESKKDHVSMIKHCFHKSVRIVPQTFSSSLRHSGSCLKLILNQFTFLEMLINNAYLAKLIWAWERPSLKVLCGKLECHENGRSSAIFLIFASLGMPFLTPPSNDPISINSRWRILQQSL